MNRLHLKNRFSSRLSLLLLMLGACTSAAASGPPLRGFSASYDLHKGSRHIATTELRLQRDGEQWRWSSLTRARGVYQWFVRKQPLVQTRFGRHANGFRLHEILVGDARKNKNKESALFDWDKGEMQVIRKGKRKQARLTGSVYDYLSIHLLAAEMGIAGNDEASVDFYRKGKLVKSRLAYGGRETIDLDGRTMQALVYQQDIAESRSRVRYFYDPANPLLPLRIETLEPGESPAVLTLRRVDWDL